MSHRLFSYGTLRQPEVQTALFGTPVPTTDDRLLGYRLEWLLIADPGVVATSGSDKHPILRKGGPDDAVSGACLVVDDEQLAAADAYEVDDYQRVAVTLESGVQAWVYAASSEGV